MKIKFKLSIIAFMLLMVFCRSIALIELTGEHICHKQENYTETINSTSSEAIQKRKNFWCIERIRCSEMQPDTKEVVRSENVTKSRTLKFCCPGYEELLQDGKKICVSNTTIMTSTSEMTPSNISSEFSTEKNNPYMNYTGEYGKEFNHYMKMGLNESDAQQSVDKLVEFEIKKASEDLNGHYLTEPDGYIIVDIAGNEIEPLKHPQFVTDHHSVSHHEENIAMVTVSCLILGMCIFLILMVYIIRKQNSPSHERDVEIIDPRFETKKSKLPPSKIVHEPLPIPPLRPSLRKHKSVTFDNSIDEVDEYDRRRTRSLPDAYDVPRKQTSMIDLYAQSIKITPKDIATYAISQKSGFHTFPKKNVTRKQSLEHIYDEIPTPIEITVENRQKSDKIDDLSVTETTVFQQLESHVYENQQAKIENERTKM